MKASLGYFLVCLGFLVLVLYSNRPHHIKTRRHRTLHPGGRRIIVRKLNISIGSATKQDVHENIAFDPVIAAFERKREDRAWEREYFGQQYKQWDLNSTGGSQYHHDTAPHPESQPEPESWDYTDPEDYLNDEDQFNISARIVALFPLIDISPPDGTITKSELETWHLQAALTEAIHRTDRQIEIYDKNRDGMISFSEYLPQASLEATDNNTLEYGGSGWWKGQFDAADEDSDGLLNHTEFNNFLHPQDSSNERLHQWLREQEVRERDQDKDGKISFTEFDSGLFDLIRSNDEDELLPPTSHNDDISARRETHAKHTFSKLDKNKDGFLTEDELVPVMDHLHPGEAHFAKQQAEYLMSQADKNKDGHLTLEEMLENPYVFYSTAYAYEDYDDEYVHDEF